MKSRLTAFCLLALASIAQAEDGDQSRRINIEPKWKGGRDAAPEAAIEFDARDRSGSGITMGDPLPVVSKALAERLEARFARDAGEAFEKEATDRYRGDKIAAVIYR